jgi:two-component system sensor histidine kinase YesM
LLKFIQKSFKREIIFGFIIVTIILLIIICSLLIQSFKTIFSDSQEKKANETQYELNIKVTNLFASLNNMTIKIENNQCIIDFLESKDNWDRKKAYSELFILTEKLKEVVEVDIFNLEGICKYSTGDEPIENKMPLNWGILKKATNNRNEVSYLKYKKYLNDIDEILLLGAKPIINKGEIKGFVVLEIHKENFNNLFQGIYNSRSIVALISEYWDEIYVSKVNNPNLIEELRNRNFDNEKINDTINGYMYYVSEISNTGISILLLQPEILSKSDFTSMYKIILIFALISFLFSLVVTNIITNYLIAPVKQLSSAMYEIKGGNFDIAIEDIREDEFGILYRDFNEMIYQIDQFTEQSLQNEKDLNEANIAMMHAQLNPHFLYNTLDTIKWSSVMHNIPQITTITTSLAKILRTSISGDKFICLEDELALVKSYIQIQKIRFDKCFEYNCILPEKLSKIKVPKLIIQPIVENAVIHGLLEMEEGIISVKCSEKDNILFIEIIDNGRGISDEVLKDLCSDENNKLKNHIGFSNVNKIIRLSYGNQYGINVEKIKEGGTRVILRMAINRGESNV